MLKQKFFQKSDQVITISKKMQLSLRILQMSTAELNDYLYNQTQDNPFLEINNLDSSTPVNEKYSANEDYSNYWQTENYMRYETSSKEQINFGDLIESNPITLKQHVLNQIDYIFLIPQQKFIAYYLTDLLNDQGYLSKPIDEIALELDCTKHAINHILSKLKILDPPGIFANNLKECLKIQLEYMGFQQDNVIYNIVDNLDKLLDLKVKQKLLKKLKIGDNDFSEYLKTIRSLNPNPGNEFFHENIPTRVVEAIIFKDNIKEQFITKLNPYAFPNIDVNSKHYNNMLIKIKDNTDKKFCTQNWQHASWILRSIEQRAQTILKVVETIAQLQQDFLNLGFNYLKPMKLTDIAKILNLHESTISRISNKFIETPLGVYQIKFFFSNSVTSKISENLISSLTIKNKIKQLIENEKKTRIVLSDIDITNIFIDQGINIARRTIMKYRKKLKFSSSHTRKRDLIKL